MLEISEFHLKKINTNFNKKLTFWTWQGSTPSVSGFENAVPDCRGINGWGADISNDQRFLKSKTGLTDSRVVCKLYNDDIVYCM